MAFGLRQMLQLVPLVAAVIVCHQASGQSDEAPAGVPQERAEAPPADAIIVEQDPRARAFGPSGVKVWGGNRVPDGALLETVGVTYGSDDAPRCTGTLIAPDIVLTAAHCVCGDMENAEARVSRVFVGTNLVPRPGERPGEYYAVADFRSAITWPRRATQEQCESGDLKAGRDLALLELRTRVTGVTPVPIADERLITGARSYRVAGFGAIDADGLILPDGKFETVVTAASNSCTGRINGRPDELYYGCLPREEIVAGSRASPDTCNGDSGGPLLVSASGDGGRDVHQRFFIAGITSRPVNDSPRACGYGGIYERLTPEAARWITSAVRSLRGS